MQIWSIIFPCFQCLSQKQNSWDGFLNLTNRILHTYIYIYLNIARKCIIHLNSYTLHALLSHLIRLPYDSIWNKICFLPYISTSNKWQLLSKRTHKGSSPCMFWFYGTNFWTFGLYLKWYIRQNSVSFFNIENIILEKLK